MIDKGSPWDEVNPFSFQVSMQLTNSYDAAGQDDDG